MLSDTDWTLLMKRFDAFEERLNKLEKDVEDLKPRYLGNSYGSVALLDAVGSDNCQINSEYVLSKGSLMDAGTEQEWKQLPGIVTSQAISISSMIHKSESGE